MTSNEILSADMLDIVFDNRNKQYGAYLLRRNYNQRLMLSLGTGLSFIFLLLLIVRNTNSSGNVFMDEGKGEVVVSTLVLPPEKVKEVIPVLPKKRDIQKPVASVKNTEFTMVKETREVVAEQTDLDRALISNRTVDGPETTGLLPRITPPGIPATGTIVEPPAAKPEAPIQREPEFPGGMKAWLEYLNANLRPASDLEPGEQKTVSIRFEVAIDGSVTGFVVVKSAGTSYDREVIRVLKKMPKWKPAIQNGQPVPRLFTQPVTFMGIE